MHSDTLVSGSVSQQKATLFFLHKFPAVQFSLPVNVAQGQQLTIVQLTPPIRLNELSVCVRAANSLHTHVMHTSGGLDTAT